MGGRCDLDEGPSFAQPFTGELTPGQGPKPRSGLSSRLSLRLSPRLNPGLNPRLGTSRPQAAGLLLAPDPARSRDAARSCTWLRRRSFRGVHALPRFSNGARRCARLPAPRQYSGGVDRHLCRQSLELAGDLECVLHRRRMGARARSRLRSGTFRPKRQCSWRHIDGGNAQGIGTAVVNLSPIVEPMVVGGLLVGLIAAVFSYYPTRRAVRVFQKRHRFL